LMGYYLTTKTTDQLSELLNHQFHAKKLANLVSVLTRVRAQPVTLETAFLNPSVSRPEHEKNLMEITLTCGSIDEATLMASMIDSYLQEQYGIPLRSSTKYLHISFQHSENAPNTVQVLMRFRP